MGLRACQALAGKPQKNLRIVQDVKTGWGSTHGMTDSLRVNQEPLLLCDVKNSKAAKGFKDDRCSIEDWSINNQSVALLGPLSQSSTMLEGKNHPTSNLALPTFCALIQHTKPSQPTKVPSWAGKLLQPSDPRPEVIDARVHLHNDLERRWVTELPDRIKRFCCICTLLDPRQKDFKFPGATKELKEQAKEWFKAECKSFWEIEGST